MGEITVKEAKKYCLKDNPGYHPIKIKGTEFYVIGLGHAASYFIKHTDYCDTIGQAWKKLYVILREEI